MHNRDRGRSRQGGKNPGPYKEFRAPRADHAALAAAGFLVGQPVWINWKFRIYDDTPEKKSKVPLPDGAQINDREWKSLAELDPRTGAGVIPSKMHFLVIDLDGAIDPKTGIVVEGYRPFVEAAQCVQRSVSGHGLHCFFNAAAPAGGVVWRRGPLKVELYGRHTWGRFIAMTGRFMPGKARLPDICDEENDIVAGLLQGWERPAAGAAGGPVTDKSGALDKLKLPPPPELHAGNEELIDIAMGLNGHPKGMSFDLMSREYPDRSSARQGLLVRLAALRLPEDRIAAFAREYLGDHYAERSNPARDLYGEIRKAIGYANPELSGWCGSGS